MESKPSDAGPYEFRLNSDSKNSSEEPATAKHEFNTSIAPVLESNIHVTEKKKSFDDLANEIFDKILKNLATSDLLNCRRVNRRWKQISSRIMRARDDITIHFEFTGDQFIQTIHHQHCEKLRDSHHRQGSKNLSDLVNCMQDSKQFPFTSYRFDDLEPSNLGNRSMRDFLTDFGKEIRSLKICLIESKRSGEILQKLVFDEAPNLKILEIEFSIRHHDYYSGNPPTPHRLTKPVNQLHLPQLKALRVHTLLERYLKIIEAILIASPNLKSISFPGVVDTKDLEMLRNTNKLHCVKETYLIGQDNIEYWLKCGSLQLQHLNLRFFLWGVHRPKVGSIETINQLFQSTKDSLSSFTTEPLGALTGLVLPKFEKLQRLCLRPDVQMGPSPSYPSYLPKFDWAATFPNIKELDISFFGRWRFGSTFRHLLSTPLPTVETLRINACGEDDIADVMKFTPNVKTLVILDDSIVWYGNMEHKVNFGDISRYLPKLENFGWELITGTKNISRIPHMCDFDAKVTGLPVNLCKNLAKEFRDKSDLSADEVAKYHSKRRGASILDLKELKNFYAELTVNDELSLYTSARYDVSDDESMGPSKFIPECNEEISKVSKLLAFDLMPNLKFFSHTVPLE